MIKPTVDSLYDANCHVIRLGTLVNDGRYLASFSSQPSNSPRTWELTRWRHDFLASIRAKAATPDREYTADEGGLLLTFADLGVLRIVDIRNGAADLDFVPLFRKAILPVADTDDGGADFRTEDGEHFHVSQFGGYLLANVDNMSSLESIFTKLRDDFASGEDGPEYVADVEAETGKPYAEAMLDEVFDFIDALNSAGAVSFEPKDNS